MWGNPQNDVTKNARRKKRLLIKHCLAFVPGRWVWVNLGWGEAGGGHL